MINNKRGLSGVIVTLITVLLAIVAIGIVWTVISSIVDSNVDTIDLATKCQGALISIDNVQRSGTTCNVTIKRLSGLSQEIISGINMSVDEQSTTSHPNNIVVGSIKIVNTVACTAAPSTATARVYFEIDGENKYCPSVSWTA